MRKRIPRWVVILCLPTALVWTFFAEMAAGIASGWRNVCWLNREQIEIAKAHWRGEKR